MIVVLQPRNVAKQCFLWEAVLCLCFNKIPLETPTDLVGKEPFDRCACSTIVPDYSALSSDTKIFEHIIDDHELVEGTGLEEKYKKNYCRSSEPDSIVEIDRVSCDLFQALTDGRVSARGRPFPDVEMADQVGTEDTLPQELSRNRFKEIPQNFWRLEKIKWFESSAAGDFEGFYHIQVEGKQLLQTFPIEDGLPITVRLVQGDLLLKAPMVVEKPSASQPDISSRSRGRPQKYDWNAILDEAIKWLEGDLPANLKSLIQEIIVWCERQGWEEVPKPSAIRGYVRPLWELRRKLDSKIQK